MLKNGDPLESFTLTRTQRLLKKTLSNPPEFFNTFKMLHLIWQIHFSRSCEKSSKNRIDSSFLQINCQIKTQIGEDEKLT